MLFLLFGMEIAAACFIVLSVLGDRNTSFMLCPVFCCPLAKVAKGN